MKIKRCECRCGKPAPIARQTNTSKGYVKGQPMRFVHGHTGGGKTHGMVRTPEHRAYCNAILRCTHPNATAWPDYGGRGIKFLLEPFEIFFMELGPKPEPKHLYSVDRINNDGNYEAGNVRWATKQEQNANKRP